MAGSGGKRGGVQPPAQPRAARDLQPEDSPPLVDLNATRAALTVLHHNGFAGAERVEAEWAAERLARLQQEFLRATTDTPGSSPAGTRLGHRPLNDGADIRLDRG